MAARRRGARVTLRERLARAAIARGLLALQASRVASSRFRFDEASWHAARAWAWALALFAVAPRRWRA